MAGLKELHRRLGSVKNTKKITYAMKLVSAAKLKKAQESVSRSGDYTRGLYQLLATLEAAQEGTDMVHPLMEKREVRRVKVLVVGGSRGLAGGYNSNLNRRIESARLEISDLHVDADIEWVLLGKKPAEYFRRMQYSYVKSYEDLSEDPSRWPIDEVCRELASDYLEKRVDEVYVVYTQFRSALSVTPELEKILPLEVDRSIIGDVAEGGYGPKVLFEPSPQEVFARLVPRIFTSSVRRACLNSKASEHGSRMTAMDSATKNAGELIDRLQLKYNKLRQSSITSELLDIIGGAEAIS